VRVLNWLFEAVLLAIVAGLAGIVGLKILKGDINTDGLLAHAGDGVAPARVQMLGTAVLAAGGYLLWVANHIGDVAQTHAIPDLPQQLVWVLGGSNGVYLWGKILNR
jgi:hypothetical protein